MPDLEHPLLIDFSGVRMASSSFLDELLGRIVATHGPGVLESKLRVAHMEPLIQHMADAVIVQRLGGGA